MRSKRVIRNILTAWGGQVLILFTNFISRSLFLKILPIEYLGINGLFSNIILILSFTELGIGSAIVYSLYEPFANNNTKKLALLINFYKKTYLVIGSIIGILGISISPFLDFFIESEAQIPHLTVIYILFIFNTSLSYFGSYNSSFICADQKAYIVAMYTNGVRIIQIIGGIILLFLFHSYIIYYCSQILATLIINIIMKKKVHQLYPYLTKTTTEQLSNKTKHELFKNTYSMLCHKFATAVVFGTDNLLISKFVAITYVGLYSNYTIILDNLSKFISQIFSSLTASIGNYNITESKNKNIELFYLLFQVNFWIYGFCTSCLFCLMNRFIELWLGKEYLFSVEIILVIILNFYLTGMRKVVLTFRDAIGLFWYDRYKAIAEAVLNLLFSIVLVKKIGIVGVLLGTTISFCTTCLWVEPYILFKHGLKTSLKPYIYCYIKYFIVTFLNCILTSRICNLLPNTWLSLFMQGGICCITTIGFFTIASYSTKEFTLLRKRIQSLLIR